MICALTLTGRCRNLKYVALSLSSLAGVFVVCCISNTCLTIWSVFNIIFNTLIFAFSLTIIPINVICGTFGVFYLSTSIWSGVDAGQLFDSVVRFTRSVKEGDQCLRCLYLSHGVELVGIFSKMCVYVIFNIIGGIHSYYLVCHLNCLCYDCIH